MKKISLIGYSDIARRRIIPAILKSSIFELYKIGTRKVQGNASGEYLWSSYDDVYNCDQTEVIYISTPPNLHAGHAWKALLNNKSVLVEKPATLSVVDWRKLYLCAVEKNLIIKEALSFEYHPIIDGINRFFVNNHSEINEINVFFCFPDLPHDNFRNDINLGGGIINDALVYPLILLQRFGINIMEHCENFTIEKNQCSVPRLFSWLFVDNNIKFKIMVGMGFEYKNCLEILCVSDTIFVPKLFSLKPDELGLIIHGNGIMEKYGPVDQVEIMIDTFLDDPQNRSDENWIEERIDFIERVNKLT